MANSKREGVSEREMQLDRFSFSALCNIGASAAHSCWLPSFSANYLSPSSSFWTFSKFKLSLEHRATPRTRPIHITSDHVASVSCPSLRTPDERVSPLTNDHRLGQIIAAAARARANLCLRRSPLPILMNVFSIISSAVSRSGNNVQLAVQIKRWNGGHSFGRRSGQSSAS